jgi:hypothetical protein
VEQLVSDGSRPDKVFKDKDVNLVAKQLFEFSGCQPHSSVQPPKEAEAEVVGAESSPDTN